MKSIIVEFTTNRSPVDIDATLAHHNITAESRILRTFPTTRVELRVSKTQDIQKIKTICNANNVIKNS